MAKRCLIKFREAVAGAVAKKGTICKKSPQDKVEQVGKKVIFTYWQCPIVIHNRQLHKTTIRNCGYYTKTTKVKINELLPAGYKVRQKQHSWYLDTPKRQGIPFKEQMTVRV